MDFATMLATFPAEVREEVLLTSDESMLSSLTPALLAEAQVHHFNLHTGFTAYCNTSDGK